MAKEHLTVHKLFENWIKNATANIKEEKIFQQIKTYLVDMHPDICGKCVPCRDGVIRLETIMDMFMEGVVSLSTLKELERLIINLRASRCSVGLDIGKNLEIAFQNNYHIFYDAVKDWGR